MRKQKINKVVGSVVVGVSLVGCMNGVSAATKTWVDMTDLEKVQYAQANYSTLTDSQKSWLETKELGWLSYYLDSTNEK